MTRPLSGLWPFSLLAVTLLAGPAFAQTKTAVARPRGPLAYDVTKETTLSGTVSSVLAKPTPGMVMGTHLIVQTSSGSIDASVGRFAFIGRDALKVAAGDSVSVTGVMKTVQGKDVFLVRTIKTGSRVFPVRNEHGIYLSPQARAHLALQPAQKGGLL